jgi:hypothetical protein
MTYIYVSLANVNDFDAYNKTHFHRQPITRFSDLADIITKSAWSPILWRDNYRRGVDFESCGLLCLDFDEGNPTLSEIIDIVWENDYRHIIGTTKSHQKLKQGVVCDRFRVVIDAEGFSNNNLQFKEQMRATRRQFSGTDSSCLESARFFFPCAKIVSNGGNRKYKAKPAPALPTIKKRIDKLKQADVELGQCGWVPDEIRAFISHGAGQGERRPALFKFAAKLTRFGWTAEKVTAKLINAPFFKDDLKTEDMLRQVERGIQYGQGYEGY